MWSPCSRTLSRLTNLGRFIVTDEATDPWADVTANAQRFWRAVRWGRPSPSPPCACSACRGQRLARLGVEYEAEIRQRVERVCCTAELNVLRRLPAAEREIADVTARLKSPALSDVDFDALRLRQALADDAPA